MAFICEFGGKQPTISVTLELTWDVSEAPNYTFSQIKLFLLPRRSLVWAGLILTRRCQDSIGEEMGRFVQRFFEPMTMIVLHRFLLESGAGGREEVELSLLLVQVDKYTNTNTKTKTNTK